MQGFYWLVSSKLGLSHLQKRDFGKGSHTSSTEPYFYEAAYLHQRDSPTPVNERGQCVVAKEVPMGEDVDKDGTPKKVTAQSA